MDSTNASAGFGLVVLRAADNRDKGLSLADNADELESMVHNTNSIFTTNDLTYLYRGGRVSKTAAAFGDVYKRQAEAFGFEVYEIDGHDMVQIVEVFDKIRAAKNGKPKFINAHTVKGKGVDYMENNLDWHGNAPNKEQYESAMAQLERGLN